MPNLGRTFLQSPTHPSPPLPAPSWLPPEPPGPKRQADQTGGSGALGPSLPRQVHELHLYAVFLDVKAPSRGAGAAVERRRTRGSGSSWWSSERGGEDERGTMRNMDLEKTSQVPFHLPGYQKKPIFRAHVRAHHDVTRKNKRKRLGLLELAEELYSIYSIAAFHLEVNKLGRSNPM